MRNSRIVRDGMGGFLDPPTYPTHSFSVETDLRRNKENRGGISLDYAAESEWLDFETRAEAKRLLSSWVPPPIDSPEIQDWIAHVLGYFKNCYRDGGPEPECWNADKLHIVKNGEFNFESIDNHAGVHFIRKFYPSFAPTEENFAQAYWGKKPVSS